MTIATTHPRPPRAFTLVELLVVIGIIALLIAVLLPALSTARESAKTVQCLANLRNMATAAQAYANENAGHYPSGTYSATDATHAYVYNWDFTYVKNLSTGERTVQPGLLWAGRGEMQVQQCPAFDGKSMTLMDPYTGYNYNASYVGRTDADPPAKVTQVRNPAETALFGDGQWASGANKFMRSPVISPHPSDAMVPQRTTGTQGFRHRKQTNVAFADGHAASTRDLFTAGKPVAKGTGFLSDDNSLYDLD